VLRGSLHVRGLAIWTAALMAGILCVWEHVYSTRLAAEIETLRQHRESVGAEIGFLRMECTLLTDRERIETYAAEQLGMRHPRSEEIIRLGVEGNLSAAHGHDEYVEGGEDAVYGG
jgi:cell division protein FtsL